LPTKEAQVTAINEVRTNAPAAPKKTDSFDPSFAAKQKVANWVLSPNSAKKIKTKVLMNNFKSILLVFSFIKGLGLHFLLHAHFWAIHIKVGKTSQSHTGFFFPGRLIIKNYWRLRKIGLDSAG
jgi:hypothetical protein